MPDPAHLLLAFAFLSLVFAVPLWGSRWGR